MFLKIRQDDLAELEDISLLTWFLTEFSVDSSCRVAVHDIFIIQRKLYMTEATGGKVC